jgi:integral membrane protein
MRRVNNPVTILRRVGFAEGVSFLLLLGVAMPLKYFAGMPQAVKIVGWLHGLLFIAYCLALLRVVVLAGWPLGRAALFFVAALLPFGPFLVDRRAAELEQAWQGNR